MFDKPIAFFDLETTGTSITQDRIVQIAACKILSPFGERGDLKKFYVNPQMPIPAGATKVHGITNEMVANAPTFASYAKSMFEYLQGCDIAGFNVKGFDVPLLAEEFTRCNIKWPIGDERYLDACKIFFIKEPRTLAGACNHYLNRTLEGAHDAGNDILATIDVFEAQLQRYPDLGNMGAKELNDFCNEGQRCIDLAGKIILNEQGVPCYSFGTKTTGVPVLDDPGFGNWMLKNDFPTDTKERLKEILFKKRTLWV